MTDQGHKALAGAASGFVAAVATDYHAFRTWKKWDEAFQYDWAQASFRWVQGVVGGIVTALGFDALFG